MLFVNYQNILNYLKRLLNRVLNMSLHNDIEHVTEMYNLRKDIILDEILESLRKDLRDFIYGATLYKNKTGQKVLPFVDLIQWYEKLTSYGIGKSPKHELFD